MLKEMKSYCHLKPGQNGTKRLVEQYGKNLLCVRYRYDEERHVKIKTVELIIEECPAGKSRLGISISIRGQVSTIDTLVAL